MQTRKLTIQMAHQDGTPFAGYASVRLSSASKTDEELVGPLVWQEAEFKNGIIELQLVPNSELEEGTFYKCQIYVVKSRTATRANRRSWTRPSRCRIQTVLFTTSLSSSL